MTDPNQQQPSPEHGQSYGYARPSGEADGSGYARPSGSSQPGYGYARPSAESPLSGRRKPWDARRVLSTVLRVIGILLFAFPFFNVFFGGLRPAMGGSTLEFFSPFFVAFVGMGFLMAAQFVQKH